MKQSIKKQDLDVIFNLLSSSKEPLFKISEILRGYDFQDCGINSDVYKVWNDVLSSLRDLNNISECILNSSILCSE